MKLVNYLKILKISFLILALASIISLIPIQANASESKADTNAETNADTNATTEVNTQVNTTISTDLEVLHQSLFSFMQFKPAQKNTIKTQNEINN